ncbi:MAG: hypothetical protein RLZZ124_753 [Cyanobacteriota bacterium]
MARALLDINVLIALLEQGHRLHRSATRWLERPLAPQMPGQQHPNGSG